MNKIGRVLRRLLIVLMGLILLILLYAFLAYPSEYVRRVLLWQNSDVYDYQKFPKRPLETGPATFYFTKAPDEAKVRAVLETNPTIDNLDTFLANTHTQAFIIIQNDRILYEKYFNGTQRDSIVTSFSMAKSFTSALIGIAIKDGYIQSVNDPITNYLPELLKRNTAPNTTTFCDQRLPYSGTN